MCPEGSGKPDRPLAPGPRSGNSWGRTPPPPCLSQRPHAPSPHSVMRHICISLWKVPGLCLENYSLEHVSSSNTPTRCLRSERGARKCREPRSGAGDGIWDRGTAPPPSLHPGASNGRRQARDEEHNSSGESTGQKK